MNIIILNGDYGMDLKIIIGIIVVIFFLVFIGLVGVAQYGAKNSNKNITVNNVAGVDNVILPGTFHPTGISEAGNDTYHNQYGDMIIYYTKTGSEITFFNGTDNPNNLPSSETSKDDQALGITRANKTIGGIKGVLVTGLNSKTNKNESTFYFIINDKLYMIDFKGNSYEGVAILLTAWLDASGYKQVWDYPATQNNTVSSQSSNTELKYLKEGEVAPHHDGWTKDDYYDAGYRFDDPNGVG